MGILPAQAPMMEIRQAQAPVRKATESLLALTGRELPGIAP